MYARTHYCRFLLLIPLMFIIEHIHIVKEQFTIPKVIEVRSVGFKAGVGLNVWFKGF